VIKNFSQRLNVKSIFLPKRDLDFSDLIENMYGIYSKISINSKQYTFIYEQTYCTRIACASV